MTVRDLVKSSMRLLGVLSAGETPSAEEQQDAISALSMMLDSWSTDGFAVPVRVREEFNLVAGTQSYTIGSSGTFNTTRPVEIEKATFLDSTATPPFENPLEIISTSEWADVVSKTQQGTPTKLYISPAYPLTTLYLYPIPDAAKKIVLYSRKILLSITNANTEITLPPGYERALKYNLAIELAPEYGKSVPVELSAIAIESKANVMRLNGEPNYLETDYALLGGRYFNIMTGEN